MCSTVAEPVADTAASVRPYDAFISYRWVEPDQSWVRHELWPSLIESGVDTLLDVHDFVPGRDLISEMTRAGESSRHVIAVISPDYFEGNRMVGFESLFARRRDPRGEESTLIPLLLRPTRLPEWLRGLIPVDWTELDRRIREREWEKLLRVLGGTPKPGWVPNHIRFSTVKPHPKLEQLSLKHLATLKPRASPGIGYELLAANSTNRVIAIDSFVIHGVVAHQVAGASYVQHRAEFAIGMESSVDSPAHGSTRSLKALVFEASDLEWGSEADGQYEYELDTGRGLERWRYTLTLPIYVEVPAKSSLVIRLYFRHKQVRLVNRTETGDFLGAYYPGGGRSEHLVTAEIVGGGPISAMIDDGFLCLLAERATEEHS